MEIIRYTLGNHETNEKFRCPYCGKEKRYRRYFDTKLQKYLPEKYGRCDRVNGCQADYNPYTDLDFLKKWEADTESAETFSNLCRHVITPVEQKIIDITNIWDKCCCRERTTNLWRYFVARFGYNIAAKTFDRYSITSSTDGADMFWMFGPHNEATTAKCINYKADSHKRDRSRHPYWVHDRLKSVGMMPADYQPPKSLFGSHLIGTSTAKRCFIVESEKTALAGFAHELEQGIDTNLWLATGGSTNTKLITAALPALIIRNIHVTLIPDADEAGQKWLDYAKEVNIPIDNIVHERSNEEQKKDGRDLADMIL